MTLRGGPHAVANEIAVSHMSGIKDVLLPLLPFRAGGLSAGSRQPRLAVIGAALGVAGATLVATSDHFRLRLSSAGLIRRWA